MRHMPVFSWLVWLHSQLSGTPVAKTIKIHTCTGFLESQMKRRRCMRKQVTWGILLSLDRNRHIIHLKTDTDDWLMFCVISSSHRLGFDEDNTSGMAHNNILKTDSINLAPCGCSSYFGDDPQCAVTVQNIQVFMGANLSVESCSFWFLWVRVSFVLLCLISSNESKPQPNPTARPLL